MRVEAAMRKALERAQREGETRPHILKKRMLAARDEAKREG